MANALYDKARQKFLEGSLDWSGDSIKFVLVTSGYSEDLANDEFLSDIVAGNRVDTSANLSAKTTTDGVADAADETITSVTGSEVVAIVLYKDTGVEGTSPLIAFIDTASGLPFTPSGGDVEVRWDSGVNRIFKL